MKNYILMGPEKRLQLFQLMSTIWQSPEFFVPHSDVEVVVFGGFGIISVFGVDWPRQLMCDDGCFRYFKTFLTTPWNYSGRYGALGFSFFFFFCSKQKNALQVTFKQLVL